MKCQSWIYLLFRKTDKYFTFLNWDKKHLSFYVIFYYIFLHIITINNFIEFYRIQIAIVQIGFLYARGASRAKQLVGDAKTKMRKRCLYFKRYMINRFN